MPFSACLAQTTVFEPKWDYDKGKFKGLIETSLCRNESPSKLSKLMRKTRRNITVLPSRLTEPTVCLTLINAIENLSLSSSCGIYILQLVIPLMQQRGLHQAMELTTALIVFANPRSWGHSKTPDLLVTAYRNMHTKIMNIQIGVWAATRQARSQTCAHAQKSVKTGLRLRSWITLSSLFIC